MSETGVPSSRRVVPARSRSVLAALRRPATYLRLVFLLLGSALAVSFLLLDTTLVALLADLVGTPLVVVPVALLIVVVPPVVLGLMPAARQVEAVAAQTLLGVHFPDGIPGPARTREQRVRAAAWFLAHVFAGTVVAVVLALFLGAGPRLLVAPFLEPPGTTVVGTGWPRTTGGWWDAWLVAAGLLIIVAAVVIPVLLGAAMARLAPVLLGPSYAERLQRLEAETTRLAERNRIARELHDSVGHALSLVTLQAAAARKVLERDPAFAERALDAIESASRAATEDLDHMLGLLRAPDEAVRRQPSPDLRALPALVAATRTAGLVVEWRDVPAGPGGAAPGGDAVPAGGAAPDGDVAPAGELPTVVSREAYRIVQEGLTNALRYATGPARLRVVREIGRLVIDIENPIRTRGRPGSRTATRGRPGRGLRGISERVAALGGTVYSGVESVGDDGVEPVEKPVDRVDKSVDELDGDALAPVDNSGDRARASGRPATGSATWRLRVELPLPEEGRP
ncbi:MAG: histidine kinase [Micromonosporaceae bacterium]